MTDEEQLADVIALVVHAETEPLLAKVAALEARPVAAPESITAITDVLTSFYPRLGALEARAAIPGRDGKDGMPGKDGLDGTAGRDGKDGMSVTTADVLPLVVAEVAKAVAAIPTPKDGAPGPPGRDGRDGQSIQGPPGEKGASGVVESVPGLDPALISAHVDVLMRKELASLEAAAPPRITKRIIRDARGKIERVIEEPARG